MDRQRQSTQQCSNWLVINVQQLGASRDVLAEVLSLLVPNREHLAAELHHVQHLQSHDQQ